MANRYDSYFIDIPEKDWNNALLKTPEEGSKIVALVNNQRGGAHHLTFTNGNYEDYQQFDDRLLINRYRVHFWMYKQDFESKK